MAIPSHITPSRGNFVFGVVFVLVFGAIVWWRSSATAVKDIPPSELAAFSAGLTLDDALARSTQTGRPVLVYATASWCPPCRGFKANTLSRGDVAAAIGEGFEAVYLDVDRAGDDARTLRVMAVPTIMVLRDGRQVDRHEGAMETDAFLGFLERNAQAGSGGGSGAGAESEADAGVGMGTGATPSGG